MSNRLPVSDCLSDVVSAVRDGIPVILRAPPGAGKTTGVPPALLSSEIAAQGQILLLQPRRIAARAAALRLSKLAGQPVGETYGYHVRFDRKTSARTKVVAMTTGVLLRRLTCDPLLEGVSCVILDEFHERSLEVDLALGMLHRVRTTLRPELRVIVMSATLDTEPVARLMPDATTIESRGRAYDVEVRYQASMSPERLEVQVARQLSDAVRTIDGDILVFLPGVGEIHRSAQAIRSIASDHSLEVCKLYGSLSPQEQDAVLEPSRARKVVLATNVAETSVTIPGIRCVIDSGLARVMQFDASVGIPSLRLQPISKASADQRAGRAGRTADGICYRMWPRAIHQGRPDHTPPEINSADLSMAVLTLAAWGEKEVMAFPWITPPREHAVQSARRLLIELGAIDSSYCLLQEGRRMNELPIHPRLSRMMIEAARQGCVPRASLAAALLSERDPFLQNPNPADAPDEAGVEDDLLRKVLRVENHLTGRRDPAIHDGGAATISRVATQLRRLVDEASPKERPGETVNSQESFSRVLLSAFPDRLARRRRPGSVSGRMVGGRGVKLDRSSSVRTSELFLCVNADGGGEEALVRMASSVQQEWLPERRLESRHEIFFHPTLQSVVARDRLFFGDLLLSESPAECRPDAATAELLYQHALPLLEKLLTDHSKTLQRFLDRWRFLSTETDAAHLPMTVAEAVDRVLRELCRSRTSVKDLARAPWLDHLKGLFSYEQLQWFDRQAPESIAVPSGNRIGLDYSAGRPPVLAVRIQEIYGWKQTPRLADGKVALQLHLLGPNHRPQQITEDLESFWQTAYVTIRKELKRRYAKHHWPDDPTTAAATSNGLKPRSP
jgi:ATP-dependent helicase HrpB